MNAKIPREVMDRFEVEYLATHGGGYPGCLAGMNLDEIEEFLQHLGFRVRKIRGVDRNRKWIMTSNGIQIYDGGYVYKSDVIYKGEQT